MNRYATSWQIRLRRTEFVRVSTAPSNLLLPIHATNRHMFFPLIEMKVPIDMNPILRILTSRSI